MVFNAIAGIFILAIVCGVGFGVASADSASDAERSSAFGFDMAANVASANGKAASPSVQQPNACYEQSVLASTSERTIDAGLEMIDKREKVARERVMADNAAALDRVRAEKAKQGVADDAQATGDASGQRSEYGLPAVDWSVGKEAFVSEWSTRIDAYLKGSPLSGYGRVFAEAAWDNGVDPRWSPAISNTESSKGAVCFMPCNAWGWGSNGWSDWETAIRAHVAGLAEGYGYCITPEAAEKYCPPNHSFWYANTHAQMAMI